MLVTWGRAGGASQIFVRGKECCQPPRKGRLEGVGTNTTSPPLARILSTAACTDRMIGGTGSSFGGGAFLPIFITNTHIFCTWCCKLVSARNFAVILFWRSKPVCLKSIGKVGNTNTPGRLGTGNLFNCAFRERDPSSKKTNCDSST